MSVTDGCATVVSHFRNTLYVKVGIVAVSIDCDVEILDELLGAVPYRVAFIGGPKLYFVSISILSGLVYVLICRHLIEIGGDNSEKSLGIAVGISLTTEVFFLT